MGKLKCDFRVVGPVQTNCYFLSEEETKECVVIDPGAEAGNLLSYIEKKGAPCYGNFINTWPF